MPLHLVGPCRYALGSGMYIPKYFICRVLMLNVPWLPAWSYVGSCGLSWGANVPWDQWVSCTCQLALPTHTFEFAGNCICWTAAADGPGHGPWWHEMAMQGGGDIWRANAPLGWDGCSCWSITAYSTCSLPMFGLGVMVIKIGRAHV